MQLQRFLDIRSHGKKEHFSLIRDKKRLQSCCVIGDGCATAEAAAGRIRE